MELHYDGPATYRIHVKGHLPKSWSDRLDMAIIDDAEGKVPAAILYGRLQDQAALLGVLNTLYGLHFPLLSVEYMVGE